MPSISDIKSLAASALGALFPSSCLSCRQPRPIAEAGLCQQCLGTLRYPPLNLCAICAASLDFTYEIDTGTEYFCGQCRQNPPPYGAAVYALAYEGPARDLIHAFKFGYSPYLAKPLAMLGRERLVPWLAARKGSVIVPTPLHWRRLYWRGYNHAYLLAVRLGRMAGLPVEEGLLTRTRHTAQQFGLSRDKRNENVKSAFKAPNPARVQGRDIILFDDIVTTGATVGECAKAIWKAKPNSVSVASLCKAGD
ncbi:MAG: ComF family protein [Nitrospinota bacterium]|nr:ComF family protein [Nitrospinota bacterium]